MCVYLSSNKCVKYIFPLLSHKNSFCLLAVFFSAFAVTLQQNLACYRHLLISGTLWNHLQDCVVARATKSGPTQRASAPGSDQTSITPNRTFKTSLSQKVTMLWCKLLNRNRFNISVPKRLPSPAVTAQCCGCVLRAKWVSLWAGICRWHSAGSSAQGVTAALLQRPLFYSSGLFEHSGEVSFRIYRGACLSNTQPKTDFIACVKALHFVVIANHIQLPNVSFRCKETPNNIAMTINNEHGYS